MFDTTRKFATIVQFKSSTDLYFQCETYAASKASMLCQSIVVLYAR